MRGVIKGPPFVYWVHYQKRPGISDKRLKATSPLTVLTTSEGSPFEQRRRTAAAPPDPERFFPTRSQVMFLRRVRFHGCILVRRPAIVTLGCGIEQHDAAAVHF